MTRPDLKNLKQLKRNSFPPGYTSRQNITPNSPTSAMLSLIKRDRKKEIVFTVECLSLTIYLKINNMKTE